MAQSKTWPVRRRMPISLARQLRSPQLEICANLPTKGSIRGRLKCRVACWLACMPCNIAHHWGADQQVYQVQTVQYTDMACCRVEVRKVRHFKKMDHFGRCSDTSNRATTYNNLNWTRCQNKQEGTRMGLWTKERSSPYYPPFLWALKFKPIIAFFHFLIFFTSFRFILH